MLQGAALADYLHSAWLHISELRFRGAALEVVQHGAGWMERGVGNDEVIHSGNGFVDGRVDGPPRKPTGSDPCLQG